MPSSSVSIREIARRANVSVATVSRVINNRQYVRPVVRDRVLSAMQDTGYQPDHVARSLRLGATASVGFLIRDIVDHLFASMAQGVDETLRAAGYTMLLATSSHDASRDRQAIDLMTSRRVDGLILAISDETDERLQADLRQVRLPIVLLDRQVEAVTFDAVQTDYLSGIREAVAYLAGLGHRRIGYIGGLLAIRPGRVRLAAFQTAMQEIGLTVDPGLVRVGSFAAEFGLVHGAELLDRPDRPTAILAAGNQVALGVIQAIRSRQLTFPSRLSLICVDDVDLFRHNDPPITVISRPLVEIGQRAARLLIQRMHEAEPSEPREEFVSTRLVIRNSCSGPEFP